MMEYSLGKGGGVALRGISSKPLRWTNLLAALIIFSSAASAAGTQDINFGDLKRPASRSEKSWTLPRVSSEASGYLQQFSEIDDGRTSQRQASRASASSSSASSSQCSGSGSYRAVLYCRTSGFVSYDSKPASSMSCGSCSSFDCESAFINGLKQSTSRSDDYSAQQAICDKYGSAWYPDKIKVESR